MWCDCAIVRADIFVGPFPPPPASGLLTVYADGASGNTAPTRVIQGSATGFSNEVHGLAADGVHQEIWTAAGDVLLVFPSTANGNAAPIRSIFGDAIHDCISVAVDLVNDEVIVGDHSNGVDSILVFPRTGNGLLTPTRTIVGPQTGLSGITGLYSVAVDPAAGEIYAAVNGPNAAILVFSSTANGNVAPIRTISGSATGLQFVYSVVVDVAHDELMVTDYGSAAIRFFARTASGNVPPKRSIIGGNTGLHQSRGATLLGDLEVLVSNSPPAQGVLAFPRSGSGNIAPTRTLGGPATLLGGAEAIAVYHPALLIGGGRFAVEATWNTNDGNFGGGTPHALTTDTGDFWFFEASNIEAVVKVINGCSVNGHFWFFAGGLTNVVTSLQVTDLQTGAVKVYDNPQNAAFLPIQDTEAFGTCRAADLAPNPSSDGSYSTGTAEPNGPSSQPEGIPGCGGLCLNDDRFTVTAHWETATQSGTATGVALTDDTGYLWFFGADNVEVVVKVINGCGLNHAYWFFAGGLTNVKVDITVTDTAHGISKTYHNLQNTAFQPIQDTAAFVTCP
jgi:hypothetical protein